MYKVILVHHKQTGIHVLSTLFSSSQIYKPNLVTMVNQSSMRSRVENTASLAAVELTSNLGQQL